MSAYIGARELRQNLSAVLKRVENGERIVVTSHNKPIAELAPFRGERGTVRRLIEEGRATPASAPMAYEPVALEELRALKLGMTGTQALEIERGERGVD